jgi:streptogramin lyase
MRRQIGAVLLVAAMVLSACGNNDKTNNTDVGEAHFSLSHKATPSNDVDGFLVTVVGQEVALSKYAKLFEKMSIPPQFLEYQGVGNDHRFADAFFSGLVAGKYKISIAPMKENGEPSDNCKPASGAVTVKPSQVSEIVLVSQCKTVQFGGIDVIAALNNQPQILELSYEPGKFVRTCEMAQLTANAYDADGDELSYNWTITAPEGALYESKQAKNTLFLMSRTAGSYKAKITACDPWMLCADFEFPIHIVMGNDEDGNGIGDECEPLEKISKVYTVDKDFDEGNLINAVHDPKDQLQLNTETKPFNFIWVAVSSKGTAVKIDTKTGAVLGEYRTAPLGRGTNPSRTTVDKNGNVWVTNRDECGGSMGSVVQIGLKENGQCQDKNGNGVIDTSVGLNNVFAWSNAGGADTGGGVSTADDECILKYVRVSSCGARHVSIDADNNVWVSGTGGRHFDLINSATGAIVRHENSVNYGGYGGLIDRNGVIWSANPMLRWDTVLPLTAGNFTGYSHDSYGLCIDPQGNVWNTALSGNTIRKFAPDGTLLGAYQHGNANAQGCVVDKNGHVWVAHSILSATKTVGHLLNDGTYIGNVVLAGSTVQATGVAVDGEGFIWATGYNSRQAYKIDPNAGPVGVDGTTPVGDVVLSTVDLGGNLYNYSDMTGSTLIGAPDHGSWAVVYDSGSEEAEWTKISWTESVPGSSSLTVTLTTSQDGAIYGPPKTVLNGAAPSLSGRFVKITVSFSRCPDTNQTPVLFDLTIEGTKPK